MAQNRERNDRRSGKNKGPATRPDKTGKPGWSPNAGPRDRTDSAARSPERSRGAARADADGWLWGRHPVLAALSNRAQQGAGRLYATPDRATELEQDGVLGKRSVERVESQALARLLPPGAVHQGLALKIAPLEGVALEDIAQPANGVIVMLDQLTDPQNVGAIFRSALAFGARGIVVQDRHAPALAGALAKASAGATERLPHARVTNLSRALERLADLGWRAVGMDGSAKLTLEQALDGTPTVIVMGSEGDGVRRLVAEHCEVMAKIPMPGGFESLNVSNAAAIALYEAARKRDR